MSRSGVTVDSYNIKFELSLNPSFSGCPALGIELPLKGEKGYVLIPLLVDVPLWDYSVSAL